MRLLGTVPHPAHIYRITVVPQQAAEQVSARLGLVEAPGRRVVGAARHEHTVRERREDLTLCADEVR